MAHATRAASRSGLLKESTEVPPLKLTQAAQEVSSKAVGSRWCSREDCHSPMPGGANQAAYPELRKVKLDTPEGLIAGQGHAVTRPGHTFQFHQANTAEERSSLAGVHQWVNERKGAQKGSRALDWIHHPMLCNVKNCSWQMGTVSIREEDQLATGFRFVNWYTMFRVQRQERRGRRLQLMPLTSRLNATRSQNTQESAIRAEISLTETSSAESEENIPPSEVRSLPVKVMQRNPQPLLSQLAAQKKRE